MSDDKATTPPPPAEPTSTVVEEALAHVLLRNDFYRDSYHRMLSAFLLLLVVIAGLIGFTYFLYLTRPTPHYFATTPDGKLIEMPALNQPNLQTNTLLQWATSAATAAYTFNFVNYKEALQAVSQYFTTAGYESFLQALKASNNLDAVKAKKLVVSAVPTGTPVILKKGLVRSTGQYAWEVQLPLLISYQSVNDILRQDIVVTLLIVRVSTLDSPDGIGIERFIVEEGRRS